MGSSNIDDEPFMHALQLVSLSGFSMTLTAAAELNLFDIIADAGAGTYLSSSEIAAKLPTNNPQASGIVDRMLRLLAGYDAVTFKSLMVDETSGRIEMRYGANNVTKYLSKQGHDGGSLGPVLKLLNDHTSMECWYNFKNTVLDGEAPFSKAHGMTIYEFAGTNPKYNTMLNEALKGYSSIVMKKVVEVYRGFDDLSVLVDVGGSIGSTLSTIIARHPHIKGINFDLRHVIAEAPSLPGIEHIGGDMFESIPSGNAILFKSLLRDWDDEDVLKILKNCWKALPDGGKVIVINEIFPIIAEEKPFTSAEKYALLFDLQGLCLTPGGIVRTEKEYENLAKSAGFSRFKKVCSCAGVTVLEFYK